MHLNSGPSYDIIRILCMHVLAPGQCVKVYDMNTRGSDVFEDFEI